MRESRDYWRDEVANLEFQLKFQIKHNEKLLLQLKKHLNKKSYCCVDRLIDQNLELDEKTGMPRPLLSALRKLEGSHSHHCEWCHHHHHHHDRDDEDDDSDDVEESGSSSDSDNDAALLPQANKKRSIDLTGSATARKTAKAHHNASPNVDTVEKDEEEKDRNDDILAPFISSAQLARARKEMQRRVSANETSSSQQQQHRPNTNGPRQ